MERQKAIKELAYKIDWRQQLIVAGKLKKSKKRDVDIDEFIRWNKSSHSTTHVSSIIAVIFILITVCSVLAALKGIIPESFILLDLIVNYIVVKTISKDLKYEINLFESIKNRMSSYTEILGLIQDEKFEAPYLKELQQKLTPNEVGNNYDRNT